MCKPKKSERVIALAEMKIDVTKIIERSVRAVLDETVYCGKTIREWVADICNKQTADGVRPRSVWDWNPVTGRWVCPNCGKEFEPDEVNGTVWNYCPICGLNIWVE